MEECYETLKTFKSNKRPGNDGITADFYKKFWPLIGPTLLESFQESIREGEQSHSQKQAIITLFDKNKDRTLLKNWRPISLLNVDYNILSKTLAIRLTKVLPSLMQQDLTGYVKDRYIGENIRVLQDVLQYTVEQNIPGVLLALDFKKTFDSVEWNFMLSVLKKLILVIIL